MERLCIGTNDFDTIKYCTGCSRSPGLFQLNNSAEKVLFDSSYDNLFKSFINFILNSHLKSNMCVYYTSLCLELPI